MADEDQRAARKADVAGGDRREAERSEGSNDSRHEQMDSRICSKGIRFLRSAFRHAIAASRRDAVAAWRELRRRRARASGGLAPPIHGTSGVVYARDARR